jgi:hypothetical protein
VISVLWIRGRFGGIQFYLVCIRGYVVCYCYCITAFYTLWRTCRLYVGRLVLPGKLNPGTKKENSSLMVWPLGGWYYLVRCYIYTMNLLQLVLTLSSDLDYELLSIIESCQYWPWNWYKCCPYKIPFLTFYSVCIVCWQFGGIVCDLFFQICATDSDRLINSLYFRPILLWRYSWPFYTAQCGRLCDDWGVRSVRWED